MTVSKEAARNELMRRGLLGDDAPTVSPKTQGISKEAARAELVRRGSMPEIVPKEPKPAPKEFPWSRFLGEQLLSGGLGMADLAALLLKAPPGHANLMGGATPDIEEEQAHMKSGLSGIDLNPVSGPVVRGAKELGIDLQSQGPGNTGLQRIAGSAARGLGGGAAFGPMGAAFGALQGAGSQGLQEAGVPPLVAEVGAMAAPSAASRIIKKLMSSISSGSRLPDAEQRVSQYLHGLMGEKEALKAVQNIKNKPSYPITGYEPMTAEIAETPALSQLHRLRYETAGSGLPERSATQREALGHALEANTLKAAAPKEIKSMVGNELSKREAARTSATKAGYESVEKMKEPLRPTHLMKYIKGKEVAGNIRRDLNKINDEIMPLMKQSKSDMEYRKLYEGASPAVRERMEAPTKNAPSVAKLAAIDADLTAQIEGFRASGKKQRALILRKAQEELRKDLEHITPYKEARSKYAELSGPVNEIAKHPTLKGLPKSTANEVMSNLFDKNSTDNLQSLKKAVGGDKDAWRGIQESTIKHLERSITNAGAEGGKQILSYPKMRRFLDNHQQALGEVLSPDQLKFMDELSHSLRGQNIAKTLGRGEGSPTAARLSTDLGMKQGLGMKGVEAATHLLPGNLGGKQLRGLLYYWRKNSNADIMKVLDSALIDPAVAHKLLSHNFKSQYEFNSFMNKLAKPNPAQTVSGLSNMMKGEEE